MPSSFNNNGVLSEVPMVFDVGGESVVGVFHQGAQAVRTGVVFVVGGRQYRTGAQRQFVRLSRHLASHGYSSFRFDTRGMGDSAASQRHFLDTDQDIKAAIVEFQKQAPWIDRVVLWGLCDGASASIGFAASETVQSVQSVIMVNPWITTNAGAARAVLKHHYWQQFVSVAFWKRVMQGEVNFFSSVRSLLADFYKGFSRNRRTSVDDQFDDLPSIVFSAMERFKGEVAIITSDRDLTAQEFLDAYSQRDGKCENANSNTNLFTVNADHSFSSPEQHENLQDLTLSWCTKINSL